MYRKLLSKLLIILRNFKLPKPNFKTRQGFIYFPYKNHILTFFPQVGTVQMGENIFSPLKSLGHSERVSPIHQYFFVT